ncbi:UvrD-helicase domain-containing protein [Oceanotoga teriensis]|nr:UvrD-helicase domain-containing protein [Oceanotoga teriensis]
MSSSGSGKTFTITHKIAYLIAQGTKPENIMLVTFTKASAKEMLNRTKHIVNDNINSLTSGTFHSIAYNIIKKYSSRLNLKKNTDEVFD